MTEVTEEFRNGDFSYKYIIMKHMWRKVEVLSSTEYVLKPNAADPLRHQ